MMGLLAESLLSLAAVPLAGDVWDTVAPGVVVIFVIIGIPVYTAFLGWFMGKPRNLGTSLLGLTLFFGLVTALWGGLFVTTLVIRLFFF